jgi:predicted MFS family arabinose efflux permease
LIPLVADRYGVSLGTAGLISAAQVTGFALTTFVAGRWWQPSRSKLVAAALIGAAFDAASALSGSFALLLVFRLVAGAGAGVFTWLAWADAMRDQASMRRISGVGPVTVLLGAPVLAWIGSIGGAEGLYWAIAVTPLPVIFLRPALGLSAVPARRGMSPSRSNLVLLVALGVMTMASSALFVFIGGFATSKIGMGAVAVSLGFSVNAGAGLVAARWRRRPRFAWPWMLGITASASLLIMIENPVAYYVGMFGWGFAFWMAVPRVLTEVAEWSLAPDERVGDAQSIMAVGRAIGPVAGAVLVGAGTFGPLGAFTGLGLGSAAVTVGLVERYRRDREAPQAGV